MSAIWAPKRKKNYVHTPANGLSGEGFRDGAIF